MNRIIGHIGLAILLLVIPASCSKLFLEKPLGNDQNVNDIFSTEQKALGAVAQAYGWGLASGIAMERDDIDAGLVWGTLSHLSGEVNDIKFNWEESWIIQRSGMTADNGSGNAVSEDGFLFNYKAIRQCYLVYENIDKVQDMTRTQKEQVKAEMLAIIAYRYEEMFKRYGGVPIVESTLSVTDNMRIGRATLQQTLDHIKALCDRAVQLGIPDSWPFRYKGRMTKGAVLAIKAEACMYAARPLFNSAEPYLDNGAGNSLICFGEVRPQLWEDARDASLDVLEWAEANGYGLINTGSPFDDYGTAVATPGNMEVLLAYKDQRVGSSYDPHTQSGGANSMSFHMLQQYHKADGTEQEWPAVGEERPYSDFAERIEQMEPRYKVSAMAAGINAWNNPGDEYWSCRTVADGSVWEGRHNNEGCGRRVKFWYMAGQRNWFEYPIYRIAEFHLNLAEAYNELDDTRNSLIYLNNIRRRAGMPEITTDDFSGKDELRKIIQREWAVEFYEEGHRLFDVKHWKHPDIGNGIIGGSKYGFVYEYIAGRYGYTAEDYISYSLEERYTGFWADNQYLSPIPNNEINKGYISQNPGY